MPPFTHRVSLLQKEDYDGAEPAASSIALSNLLRLAALSSPEEAERLQNQAGKVAAAFQGRLMEMPLALTQMACSLQLHAAGVGTSFINDFYSV